jgi:hypothetical protein
MKREKLLCSSVSLALAVVGLVVFGLMSPSLRPTRFFKYTGPVSEGRVTRDQWLRCNLASHGFVVTPIRVALPAETARVQHVTAALQSDDKDAPKTQFGPDLDHVQYVPRLLWSNSTFFLGDHTASGDQQSPVEPRNSKCDGLALLLSTWGEGSIADFVWRLMLLYQFTHDFSAVTGADKTALFGKSDIIVWSDFGPWERHMLSLAFPSANPRAREEIIPLEGECWRHSFVFTDQTPFTVMTPKPAQMFRKLAFNSYHLSKTIPRDDNGRNLVIIQREGMRQIANVNSVAAELKAWGFDVMIKLWTKALTFKDQVQTMANASVAIGAHGSELVNVLFMHEQGTLIELFPPMSETQWCGAQTYLLFRRLALQLKLRYFLWRDMTPVPNADNASRVGVTDGNINVDSKKFMNLVHDIRLKDNCNGARIYTCTGPLQDKCMNGFTADMLPVLNIRCPLTSFDASIDRQDISPIPAMYPGTTCYDAMTSPQCQSMVQKRLEIDPMANYFHAIIPARLKGA